MDDSEHAPGPHVLVFEQLRTALNGVVDLAVERFGSHLDVTAIPDYHDHYRHLPADTAYAMDDDPGLHVGAGQSSDDLEELTEMVCQPHGQVLWHSAEHHHVCPLRVR